MSDKHSVFVDNLTVLTSPEGMQKYLLGTKKNGAPRALYDVFKDVVPGLKKNKKDKHKSKKGKKSKKSMYNFYISTKKKKGKKHWHI